MAQPNHHTTLAALHATIALAAVQSGDWALALLEFLLALEYWRRRRDINGGTNRET